MPIGLYEEQLKYCNDPKCVMCKYKDLETENRVAELCAYVCGYFSFSANNMSFKNGFHNTALYIDPPFAATDEGGLRIVTSTRKIT